MTAIEFQYQLVNHEKNLMGFACSLTSNKDDAKDLVQETYLKALKYHDKFIQETNFKAWLYTILKNTFVNNYRRSKSSNTYSEQTREGFYMNYLTASESDNPESVLILNEIEKIIETLDEDFKMPFKMHHAGYKYKEISEKLDLNLGTVKSRIFFTRKKLIKQLNK